MNGQNLFLLQPGKNPIQDAGFAPAIHPCVDDVGGGVKVVEKRRFENPAGVSLERNSFWEV
jgi:hypothetical protein